MTLSFTGWPALTASCLTCERSVVSYLSRHSWCLSDVPHQSQMKHALHSRSYILSSTPSYDLRAASTAASCSVMLVNDGKYRKTKSRLSMLQDPAHQGTSPYNFMLQLTICSVIKFDLFAGSAKDLVAIVRAFLMNSISTSAMRRLQ